MSEFKEVWYPVSQSGKVSIYAVKGVIREGKGMPIYTLGQKRRRVECSECKATGVNMKRNSANQLVFDDCDHCQGTGKAWKYKQGVE